MCKCTSICRLRPALSNFICCQILAAAEKNRAEERSVLYIYLYTYICTYICTYLCTLGIVKFDFLVICGQEHFTISYEPLKDFYRPKQKKRAFYRSLVSPASPTNGPAPVFSPICTYLRISLLGRLPTAPPFTLFFVPFKKYWHLYCALLHHRSRCKVFRIFFAFRLPVFAIFFGKFFLLALEEVD